MASELNPDSVSDSSPETEELLPGLGRRVKIARARRGMPRRLLAELADVSERHLANLESGTGNVSVLVLQQVAAALDCSLAELLGDETTRSPEWLMIRKILHGRSAEDLREVHRALAEKFSTAAASGPRSDRIALVGLRGAGKSTLGRMAGEALGRPFVELRLEITRLAGCGPAEITALYGTQAYRRYERQALEEALHTHPQCVIATAGGLVGDPATFDFLLRNCLTLWLQAEPEDHIRRVLAQGDQSLTTDARKAISDLKLTLESRAPFYAKADVAYNTSGKTLSESFAGLMEVVNKAIG